MTEIRRLTPTHKSSITYNIRTFFWSHSELR